MPRFCHNPPASQLPRCPVCLGPSHAIAVAQIGRFQHLEHGLVLGEVRFHEVDALGGDHEARSVVLQYLALGFEVLDRKKKMLSGNEHHLLDLKYRKSWQYRIDPTLGVEQTKQPHAPVDFSIHAL